jgi:2-polyprenyl-3-methyl-5-hydroxy-6-metoxy-1,4-benzoquinol methylase
MAGRVCPWWIGYVLASPLRRLIHDPVRILGDYVKPGMKVLDVGCAMGFFSLAMAKMVGSNGRVVCVDLQARMIKSLERRAARDGLLERIDPRVCSDRSLEINDLAGQVDFVLAFHVVHEVPDAARLMTEIHTSLKPGERFFIVEPKGHASADEYQATETAAKQAGFAVIDHPKLKRDWATMFVRS